MVKSNPEATTSSTFSTIPALHAFDPRACTWQSYRDRISFYFKANRINVDDDKKSLFLWSVGDSVYNLLESLVSPKLLTDGDLNYTDLITILDSHYDATKNIMTSTYDFYSCYQKPGQSFSEWKAELCDKLRYCGFTTSVLKDKPQDRALRDMLVIGVNSPKIRQALLKEKDPDLETAEKIIQLGERLDHDVRHFNLNNNSINQTVAKVHQKGAFHHRSQLNNDSHPTNTLNPCQTCGSTSHSRSECKYRTFTCNHCKRIGHLARVCRHKEEERHVAKHIQSYVKLNRINQQKKSSSRSTEVSFQVNNQDVTFDLDTGSVNTIISEKEWFKIGSPRLNQSNLQLECYSGATLTIKGECTVKVEHENEVFNLSAIVIRGTTPPLLGLAWIKRLRLDLNGIIHGSNSVKHSIHKINSRLKSQTTVTKPQIVLNKELEAYSNVPVHVQRKRQRKPPERSTTT